MTPMLVDPEVMPHDAHGPRVPAATARPHAVHVLKVASTVTHTHLATTDHHDPVHAAQARRVRRAATTVIVTRDHPGPARSTRTVELHVPSAAMTVTAVTVVRASRRVAPGPTRETDRATRVPVVRQMVVPRVRAT